MISRFNDQSYNFNLYQIGKDDKDEFEFYSDNRILIDE